MDVAGAVAMPLSIFAFILSIFLMKQVGMLQTKITALEKQLAAPPQRGGSPNI
jgi:hypothetical protein